MSELENGNSNIEFIKGATNILLIAPHGHKKDDENTGTLTRLVAEQSGCYAIINEYYGRKAPIPNRINLNHLPQVKECLEEEFLNLLIEYKNDIVKNHGSVWVFWIHGAGAESIEKDLKKGTDVNPKNIKVLVGYGQDTVGTKQRHTTTPVNNVEILIQALNREGLETVAANDTIRQKNLSKKNKKDRKKSFCGWSRHNMNQLFRVDDKIEETLDYQDPNVQSFQLEFIKLGCRDTQKNIEDTAPKLVKAISALLPLAIEPDVVKEEPRKDIVPMDGVDDEIVENAYQHLKGIFVKHFQNAMLEAGQYLIEQFYDGDYIKAGKKKYTRNKSLSMLIKRIQEDAEKKGDAPSRTWIYDAVNLAIDNNLFEQKKLPSVYEQLGHSHKVNLTSAPDKVKPALVKETAEHRYSVARLRERIREEKQKLNSTHISLNETLSIAQLMDLTPKQLGKMKAKTIAMETKAKEELNLYEGNLELIRQALNKKEK